MDVVVAKCPLCGGSKKILEGGVPMCPECGLPMVADEAVRKGRKGGPKSSLARLEAQRRYAKTKKGLKTRQRYRKTDKHKLTQKKFQQGKRGDGEKIHLG